MNKTNFNQQQQQNKIYVNNKHKEGYNFMLKIYQL